MGAAALKTSGRAAEALSWWNGQFTVEETDLLFYTCRPPVEVAKMLRQLGANPSDISQRKKEAKKWAGFYVPGWGRTFGFPGHEGDLMPLYGPTTWAEAEEFYLGSARAAADRRRELSKKLTKVLLKLQKVIGKVAQTLEYVHQEGVLGRWILAVRAAVIDGTLPRREDY